MTVSVVSHGHGSDVVLLLEDLAQQAAADVAAVILTLNLPEEQLTRAVRSRTWPFDVVLLENPFPLGFGANHNRAFARCHSPFFCVANPDIRLRGNPYPAMLAALRAQGVGCAYPMQSAVGGKPCDLAREIPTPLALLRRHLALGRRHVQLREWVNGSFMLFSSPIYRRLNGFDPRFFMYCEDVDICLRLQQKGFRLVLSPDAQVEHSGRHASRRQLLHLSWHLASLVRFWWMHGCGAYRPANSADSPR